MAAVLPLFAAGGFTTANVLGALGTVASLGSALFQSSARQKEAKAEQVSAQYNAAIDRISTAEEERKARRDQYLRGGAQLAAGGAQGRGLTGDVLNIIEDSAYQSELDILGLRSATDLNQQLAKTKISASKTSAKMSSASSILTGVASLTSGRGVV